MELCGYSRPVLWWIQGFLNGVQDSGERNPTWDSRCASRWEAYQVLKADFDFWLPNKDGQCRRVPVQAEFGLPQSVNILATDDWLSIQHPNSRQKAYELLSDVYRHTLEVYKRWGLELPLFFDFVLTTLPLESAMLVTIKSNCVCPTLAPQFFTDYLLEPTFTEDKARQAVAHEIYHCVVNNAETKLRTLWIMEGACDFFSNVAYPATDNERRYETDDERRYLPHYPIYDQPKSGESDARKYATNIFFQSLAVGRNPTEVNRYVLALLNDVTDVSERTRLSRHATFTDDFYEFAKLYTIVSPPTQSAAAGRDLIETRIPDTCASTNHCPNGRYRQIRNVPESWPTPLEGSPPIKLEVQPFTVRYFSTSLKRYNGKTLHLSAAFTANQRAAYRLSTEDLWKDLPASLSVPCTAEENVPDILFLFTSTKDADTDFIDVVLTVTNEKREENSCVMVASNTTNVCGNSIVPIDPCLLGHDWVLDNQSMENLLRLTQGGHSSGAIQWTGRQTMRIDTGSKSYTESLQNVKMIIASSVAGLSLVATVVQNGFYTGSFAQLSGGNGTGSICMAVTQIQGSQTVVTEVNGKVEDMKTGALTSDTTAAATGGIPYVCKPGKLSFHYEMRGKAADMVYLS